MEVEQKTLSHELSFLLMSGQRGDRMCNKALTKVLRTLATQGANAVQKALNMKLTGSTKTPLSAAIVTYISKPTPERKKYIYRLIRHGAKPTLEDRLLLALIDREYTLVSYLLNRSANPILMLEGPDKAINALEYTFSVHDNQAIQLILKYNPHLEHSNLDLAKIAKKASPPPTNPLCIRDTRCKTDKTKWHPHLN